MKVHNANRKFNAAKENLKINLQREIQLNLDGATSVLDYNRRRRRRTAVTGFVLPGDDLPLGTNRIL
jgi:hypothetical protein